MGGALRIGGLDVGQKTDHSALSTLREVDHGEQWAVESVVQLPLGLSFRGQVARLQPAIDRLDMLIVDSGGTGQAMPEFLHGAKLQKLVPAVIIGGTSKGKLIKGRVSVGKTYLVQGLLNMIHTEWLTVDPDAPGRDVLFRELKAFQYVKYGKFRKAEAAKGHHDDCVLSLCLAAYLARTTVRQGA